MRFSVMIATLIAAVLVASLSAQSAADAGRFFLKDGQQVVFLGDSNTAAGGYIEFLDGYLFSHFPKAHFDLVNLGLPSETVSGLSEADHPYPRPDVHERLERVFAKTKPNVVVVCYGMNDGIYHPFSEERFARYKQGIESVLAAIRKAGAKPVLMTPPPFDPVPLGDRTLPINAPDPDRYGYLRPFHDYDEVMKRYADWILTFRKKGLVVIDLHSALTQYLLTRRRTDPMARLAGDGVHIDNTGHRLVANAILEGWHVPKKQIEEWDNRLLDSMTKETQVLRLAQQRQRLLGPAWLTYVGHKRPDTAVGMPLEEAQEQAAELERQIREVTGAR